MPPRGRSRPLGGDATIHFHPSRIERASRRLGLPGALALAASLAWSSAAPAVEPDPYPVTLASFSTTLIGSSPARTRNLQLTAAALDGVELAPGEVLSFNRQVGPRTRERGYLEAPVILRETRQLQLGGGICQAASTLFVAALSAGLSAVERWRHSNPVDYIALGEDATISWGVKDLRLRNDLEQRVRVRVEVLGNTLAVRIEGEEEPAEHFELETVERETAPGDGAGREIELFRIRRRGGEAVEREWLLRDVYPPAVGPPPGAGR